MGLTRTYTTVELSAIRKNVEFASVDVIEP